MSKKALLIVDMLNDFIDEEGTLYCGEQINDIVPLIQNLLMDARAKKDLVIFIQDSHDEDDREFSRYPKHAVKGTWGNRIIDSLAPQPGEKVIPKKTLSSFYETDLEKFLIDENVGKVEVVGVCTSICVMDAVGDLTNRGYAVNVPSDAVGDFDQQAHAFALQRMKNVYGAEVT